jgi:para-aminobenzoate synthetase component I
VAGKMNRYPLIAELETALPPEALFELFRGEPYCFFLDSSMDPVKLGRYSLMGSRPFLLFKTRDDTTEVTANGRTLFLNGNPLDVLGKYLDTYRLDHPASPVPCAGGAFGYFAYDVCHYVERLPRNAVDDLGLPQIFFGFYDMVLVYDNLLHKAFLVSTGFPEQEDTLRLKAAAERTAGLKQRLLNLPAKRPEFNFPRSRNDVELKGNFDHEGYLSAVARARQYIINGDIFEVNLSQRFETDLAVPPYELYLRLREINPAPFAAYLDFDEVQVVSASPERFLRLDRDCVETRPIKGTRRRGSTPGEDRSQMRDLLSSAKDRAENMMIVDLERNDLGRVCRYGSVKVTELAILEKFPAVFHLTSTVTGQLAGGKNRIDLLKATLPGGSITGAPKVRAMEIIDELEPTRRSIYTGNLGYLSFDGNIDLNIVIRTFLIKDKKAYFQVGGAVVYDSSPEAEYQETLDKGRALVRALQR